MKIYTEKCIQFTLELTFHLEGVFNVTIWRCFMEKAENLNKGNEYKISATRKSVWNAASLLIIEYLPYL